MADVHELLRRFGEIANNPRAQLDKYLAQGKKVIGCMPVYVPEELVHAGGMIPIGLWGGQVAPKYAGKYNPEFTCSIMRSCLEYGMTGVYRGLSGVMLPILCDTFRGMVSSWRAGTELPLIVLCQPQNRDSMAARFFLYEEYRATRAKLEKLCGCVITESALAETIRIYNEHSAAMMDFVEKADEHLDLITCVARHSVMKSALFMEKSEHTAMVRELIAELDQLPPYRFTGKKLVLSGITAEPDELLAIFDENNIRVVADDLAQESRQYRTCIPETGRPMEDLAEQWFLRQGCSLVHEKAPDRGNLLVEMAKKHGADGVAICLMRFCDVEEYDYPYVSQAVEAAGLICLNIEIDQGTQSHEQSRTKLQSFAEM